MNGGTRIHGTYLYVFNRDVLAAFSCIHDDEVIEYRHMRKKHAAFTSTYIPKRRIVMHRNKTDFQPVFMV